MTKKEKDNVVRTVRILAEEHKLTMALTKRDAHSDWKNTMLHMVSPECVLNQFKCLHPFQLYLPDCNVSAGVFAFKANMYSTDIYMKLNIQSREVISFHYDEPLPAITLPPVDDEAELQIIVERAHEAPAMKLAMGSSTVYATVEPGLVDGYHSIPVFEYEDILKANTVSYYRETVSSLLEISKRDLKPLDKSQRTFDILSFSADLPVDKALSICQDIWLAHSDNVFIMDKVYDVLLNIPLPLRKSFYEKMIELKKPNALESVVLFADNNPVISTAQPTNELGDTENTQGGV